MIRIINPLQMNDWDFKDFTKFIIFLQVSLLLLIGLANIGVYIPILREILAFVYLSFIPGLIILRIMRLHKLGDIKTLLYSTGLSISFLMGVGALLNIIYLFFGVFNPISLIPLLFTVIAVTSILLFISYKRDGNFSDPDFIDGNHFSFTFLFLCLLPVLAVFGSYLVTFYKFNLVSLILLIFLGSIIILVSLDKIPEKYYSFTLFVTSLSLIYQISLVSTYIYGTDIQQEYYLANLVIKNAYWNYNLPYSCNAMLSTVIIPPIYSIIANLSLVNVYKIVYPIFFSLVPLGLYFIFKKQTNAKVAFVSCFFFVSLVTFYELMLHYPRQQLGELFLVLILLTLFSEEIKKEYVIILYTIFFFSLVFSHYSLTSYFLILLTGLLILSFLSKINSKIGFISNNRFLDNFLNSMKIENDLLLFVYLIIFVLSVSFFYFILADGVNLNLTIGVFHNILNNCFTAFTNSKGSQGLGLITINRDPLHDIGQKYIHIITQILIVIGFFKVLKDDEFKFKKEYLSFSFLNLVILVLCIFIPGAELLGTARIYQITLIFLAPLCIIGGITVLKVISKLFSSNISNETSMKVLSIFFVIFLFFNSGLIYYILNDGCQSIALNMSDDSFSYNTLEVNSCNWLNNYGYGLKVGVNPDNGIIVSDYYRNQLFRSVNLNVVQFTDISQGYDKKFLESSLNQLYHKKILYLYFGTNNILQNRITCNNLTSVTTDTYYVNVSNLIFNENEIYSSKGSQIYMNTV